MAVIVVMSVVVTMFMPMPAMAVIRAMHRLEWFDRIANGRAKANQHVADDMVAADQYPVFVDLRGEMPVAEMPGEMAQRGAFACPHLVEFFFSRDDFGQTAIVQNQPVAMFQHDRFGQIDQQLAASGQFQNLSAQMPLIVLQNDSRKRRGKVGCVIPARDLPSAGQLGEIGVEGEFHGAWR